MKTQKILDLEKIAMTDRPNALLGALERATDSKTASSAGGTWTEQYTAAGKAPAGQSSWAENLAASGKPEAPAAVSPWGRQFTATGKAGGKPQT